MKNKLTVYSILGTTLLTATLSLPAIADTTAAQTATAQQMKLMESALNDSWLDGKLEATLLFNQYLNSFDIDTDVKNGIAYLSGAVESDIEKELAGEIAHSIRGIKSVKNDLVVDKKKAEQATTVSKERESFKQSVLNATLTARVKSQLLLDSHTDGLDIDVDSSDGVITLSGTVESGQEKQLALKIAENTDGAKSVIDKLKVAEA